MDKRKRNVALIPVRYGSNSIPLKNIKLLHGKPLVYWCAKAADDCELIDTVYIAADDDRIKIAIEPYIKNGILKKTSVIGRSSQSASDTAATETVMCEFAAQYDFDTIVLLQATSPMTSSEDLYRGLTVFESEGVDSVLSAVKQKRFIWSVDDVGNAIPMNYDYYNRPRRQDMDGYWVENGAFYITSKKRLLESKCRISGNIRLIPMGEESYIEIDEPIDWQIVNELIKRKEL